MPERIRNEKTQELIDAVERLNAVLGGESSERIAEICRREHISRNLANNIIRDQHREYYRRKMSAMSTINAVKDAAKTIVKNIEDFSG